MTYELECSCAAAGVWPVFSVEKSEDVGSSVLQARILGLNFTRLFRWSVSERQERMVSSETFCPILGVMMPELQTVKVSSKAWQAQSACRPAALMCIILDMFLPLR
jgi:hypothetical protein